MKGVTARCLAALRFLTIFPLPGSQGHDPDDLAGSLPFFPLVGLLLGLLAAPPAWLFWTFLPAPVAAVFLTLLLAGFSGGLHLDGLADSADGLFSARPRERILAIMRDSRIGAMGVIALVLLLLFKVTALGSMERDGAVRAALLMPLAGRSSIVLLMAVLPYARPEGGLGTLFYSHRSRTAALVALAFVLSCSLILVPAAFPLLLVTLSLVLAAFALFCRRMIGGATGDTLGAACELGEVCVALSLCAGGGA